MDKSILSPLRAALPHRARVTDPDAQQKRALVGGLLGAIDAGHAFTLTRSLIAHPELLTERSASGHTALTYAAQKGNTAAVKAVFDAVAQLEPESTAQLALLKTVVDTPDRHGLTALAHAAQRGSVEVTNLLLHHNGDSEKPLADVNLADAKGRTPLYQATQKGHSRRTGAGTQVALAILKRADLMPDQLAHDGKSPMEIAIARGKVEIVAAIADHKNANPNRRDGNDLPPLWQAVQKWENHPDYNGLNAHWGTMLQTLAANSRVDLESHKGGRPLLHHICSHAPYDGYLRAGDEAKWLVKTMVPILEATRKRGDRPERLKVNAIDRRGYTAMEIAAHMAKGLPEYHSLVSELRRELAYRLPAVPSVGQRAEDPTAELTQHLEQCLSDMTQARAAVAHGENEKAHELVTNGQEHIFEHQELFDNGDFKGMQDFLMELHSALPPPKEPLATHAPVPDDVPRFRRS